MGAVLCGRKDSGSHGGECALVSTPYGIGTISGHKLSDSDICKVALSFGTAYIKSNQISTIRPTVKTPYGKGVVVGEDGSIVSVQLDFGVAHLNTKQIKSLAKKTETETETADESKDIPPEHTNTDVTDVEEVRRLTAEKDAEIERLKSEKELLATEKDMQIQSLFHEKDRLRATMGAELQSFSEEKKKVEAEKRAITADRDAEIAKKEAEIKLLMHNSLSADKAILAKDSEIEALKAEKDALTQLLNSKTSTVSTALVEEKSSKVSKTPDATQDSLMEICKWSAVNFDISQQLPGTHILKIQILDLEQTKIRKFFRRGSSFSYRSSPPKPKLITKTNPDLRNHSTTRQSSEVSISVFPSDISMISNLDLKNGQPFVALTIVDSFGHVVGRSAHVEDVHSPLYVIRGPTDQGPRFAIIAVKKLKQKAYGIKSSEIGYAAIDLASTKDGTFDLTMYKKPVDYTLDPSKQREMGWKMKVQLASVCVGNKAFDAC
eukprot:CAMPEP_0197516266 /NCGR_PEP_ID=MMETSP1318-20131121/1125_1 /TAXON_ID=552666 /ORGANISM="Partenskyella glossopodia, Strain RCC365" /LENGTH=491 /DNA_ID=CAMNT_0043064855 /DNA_START=21 /DNA_END=1496 /DNA_ORIENTATION=-